MAADALRTGGPCVYKTISQQKSGVIFFNFKSAMEKTSYSETSCRYLHQTDFARRSPRSQKIRISKGF